MFYFKYKFGYLLIFLQKKFPFSLSINVHSTIQKRFFQSFGHVVNYSKLELK